GVLKEHDDLGVRPASADVTRGVRYALRRHRAQEDQFRLDLLDDAAIDVGGGADAADDVVRMTFHQRYESLAHQRASLDQDGCSTIPHTIPHTIPRLGPPNRVATVAGTTFRPINAR